MQILTPAGFQQFDGIKRYWHEKYLKFVFEDNSIVECAFDHRFIVNGNEVFARDVKISDNIGKNVKDIIEISKGDYFYDPVNVSNGKIYSHDNGFVSHNTFHGTGNTLISADVLLSLKAGAPIYTQNGVKVYKRPEQNHDYQIFVDVAKGRGMDYSTFNVIDVSTQPFEQVAVYRDNLISPLLLPDIIYKYAKTYNEAWIIVESNDQGAVVCNGLYYDLEYENVFVESAIKANAIGVNMNKKVKRIGCSNIKDLIEQKRINIQDADTIIELSTFVGKGQSYEASDNNHDDLVMNLVLFGWFTATPFFSEMTNIELKDMLYAEKAKAIEDDLLPFGIISGQNEIDEPESFVQGGDRWVMGPETDLF